ncbi:hypothetical protein BGP77_08305 [Saccharospirillum sp. MSK14-1]|uniref:SMP-30/gluconolactonase/LRE family protein n=1 Tax=Saccharospirillum sp. MSK14-1 TaxID=1897632 RepID=UPI000D3D2649|nr:SMP-30/gluconolactonase/LRE family protein [Saccharospirillum sp. MSK14-1]PTY35641.1 hypothetical protein BGP77_08305 [Saccharospirillum sp. MSK14-1]
MTDQLELLFSLDLGNELGEGVQWHHASQTLWWTDIHQSRLYRYDWASQQLADWHTPDRLTSFGVLDTQPIRLLVAFASGFALYEPDSGDCQWLAQPERHLPSNRFNDGRVDRQGRFWAGTMQDAPSDTGDRQPVGTLYRLDSTGATPVINDLTIPNTLCWSPDSQQMFHADTPTGQIRRYDFDTKTGDINNEVLFAKAPRGYPDGGLIDADGYLMCALFGGSAVARFNPAGELVALHELPASQPTCVSLGGPDLNVLFVTSATEAMSDEQLKAEPKAGSLLAYATPYKGLPECTPDAALLPQPLSE